MRSQSVMAVSCAVCLVCSTAKEREPVAGCAATTSAKAAPALNRRSLPR